MSATADFFAAEAPILERLRAEIPAVRGVHPWDEMDSVLSAPEWRLPALFVLYGGHEIADRVGSHTAKYLQTWHIVLAVASRGDPKAVRAESGPLLHAVARALQDYRPAAGLGALTAITPPKPSYEPGYALFPLSFTLALSIRADDEDL